MVPRARSRLVAPLLAAALAVIVVLTGGQGVDLAAATYRVELFARSGLTLWDRQWYGGHWTFDYSVLFAPIGWVAGIPVMEVVCVALAAWAFDRLAVGRFGRAGRQLVVDEFSSIRVAQEIVALYARLLDGGTQPRPGSA